MRVSDVMTRDVSCCSAYDSLSTAARLMWDRDCGSVPVLEPDTGKVIGMITDRDICMATVLQDRAPGAITVREAMSDELHACSPEDTIVHAERTLRDNQIRRVPVLDRNGRLVGILSLADIVRVAGQGSRWRRGDQARGDHRYPEQHLTPPTRAPRSARTDGSRAMSLTLGSGPFAQGKARLNFAAPDHIVYWEPWGRRLRAVFAGKTVLDTRRAVVVHETGKFPVHWLPLEDVSRELLHPAESEGKVEGKLGGQKWSVRVGNRVAERAVTGYVRLQEGDPDLAGHVKVEFRSMDRWFEEDDPVYAHFRDPYHRIDVRSSSARVIVRHADHIVAESSRPKLLFETNVPVRYYLPFADIRLNLLQRSDTVSQCPYKGDGQHWHLVIGNDRVEDAAWSLPHPLPEGLAAAEHVCFYPEKVEVTVDGKRVGG